ncbi:hypothetical protein MGG_15580 [Pyricularia oryzae 70-15]|uniref:Uncharacterized protein n=3 Tax=Pyricularia oryzae TaxID=318829 RepID=G4MU83_PYRO7|nr:uncharacterized protein MGG_15580 [Pyricularia oryzae 70-15]EHA53964.1 hypothetical protein MGG_15580 [Pyricularia oryzae 70-15]ELQ42690.1 hypothetical protein OOU_Y34scaffold00194g2 [Pyricularia oryzae Y34]KAI7929807.1 hypothetical protein M0657_001954 [Pyricularia oryzae]
MSNTKVSSECLKSRVIELGITRRVKDGRMVTVLLEDKSEKPHSRENSDSHGSLRSASSSGMTRFEAAREAARAWSGHGEMSRRGYSSPASQESAHSTRSAPALVHRKVLSPLKWRRKSTNRGGSSKKWLEDYEQRISRTFSDSNQSSSETDRGLSPSRRSSPQGNRSRRHASHSRHHTRHSEHQRESQGPSTLVDTEASGNLSGHGKEKATGAQISPSKSIGKVTETAQDRDPQANNSTMYSNSGPSTPHATFPGFVHQQLQYHHPLNAFAAQHAATGLGTTQGFLQPSGQETTNGYHVCYVPHSYPYQVPLFSSSAVMPQPFGPSQMTNTQVQTVTACQAAAFTHITNANKKPEQSEDGPKGGQVSQYQVPQVVVYTTVSSRDSTETPLVSPTYSVDISQPLGIRETSTATTDSTMTVSTENHPKGCSTRDGTLGRISLDSEAAPRPDSMRSETSTNSKTTSQAHGRLLGPLSKHYFCFGCGRVRSKRFHRQNPLKDNQDPDTNYCANCRREHAKKAAHNSVSSLSSAYPEVVMPESSSIGSTSHLSHPNKYQPLRESSARLLPDTPTRKPTSREGGNLLCGSPEQDCLISSRGKSNPRLTTPKRQTLPGPRSVKAGCGPCSSHNRTYRPPSVESVIDSSLEYTNGTPRVEQPRLQTRNSSAKHTGETTMGAVPDISGLQHSDELRSTPLSSEPKQVRFDQRLDEWFSQSSQAHPDGSEYSQDWTVHQLNHDHDNFESHEDAVGDIDSSNSSPTVLGENQSSGDKVTNENNLYKEQVNVDDDEEEVDDDNDDDDPFAIPARSHKPKLFPVTIRMVKDDSDVSARQEPASPSPMPRFRSVSDRGSPMRNFSEKLAATKHDPVALRPRSSLPSRQPRGDEGSTTGSHCGQESDTVDEKHPEVDTPAVNRSRRAAPASVSASAFQFRASGPHNYSSLPPAPASAPPTRRVFDFSSLANDYRDESDPFYSHSISDWELEQRFQELHQAGSWTDPNAHTDFGDFAEYEECGSDMLDEDGTDCDYVPLHPDDGYFSME